MDRPIPEVEPVIIATLFASLPAITTTRNLCLLMGIIQYLVAICKRKSIYSEILLLSSGQSRLIPLNRPSRNSPVFAAVPGPFQEAVLDQIPPDCGKILVDLLQDRVELLFLVLFVFFELL